MKIIAIIPARGGSKRLKRKNIVDICGKPMLYWAIKACKESKYDIECYVSSEDDEIKSIAANLGAKIHNRKRSLSDDQTYKQDVIVSALEDLFEDKQKKFIPHKKKPDIVISLQANTPQITGKIIDDIIDLKIKKNKKEIFSVDSDLMQNGAIRVMDYQYAFLKTLSMYCGVFICDLIDVHTVEDLLLAEQLMKK